MDNPVFVDDRLTTALREVGVLPPFTRFYDLHNNLETGLEITARFLVDKDKWHEALRLAGMTEKEVTG